MLMRGMGYAGEGDLLTAALVGALLSEFPDTSFMEMFCPDWTHDAVYISHMGEFNLRVGKGRGRLQVDRFQYTSAGNPTVVFDTFRPGPAVIVNLAPMGNGRFRLVLAPVELLDVRPDNAHADTVNGWFRPAMPIALFLEAYSRAGGTHHSALVYGVRVESMRLFGQLLGFETVVIA